MLIRQHSFLFASAFPDKVWPFFDRIFQDLQDCFWGYLSVCTRRPEKWVFITTGEPKNHLTANSLKWYCKNMNMTAAKLVSEALQMPSTVRAFVAERIIESLDFDSNVDLSPEWKAEIDKRCHEMDEGTVSLIDADEVFKKAYARLS